MNHTEGRRSMADSVRVQVLMSCQEAERFDAYCQERGFKKSTLIARLIREYLAQEHFAQQQQLFKSSEDEKSKTK
jgi:metal-responsive CopG/Arc/MetJ family transcriptional regulator